MTEVTIVFTVLNDDVVFAAEIANKAIDALPQERLALDLYTGTRFKVDIRTR